MAEWMPLILFLIICLVLMLGFPVAFTLGGVSLLFAGIGLLTNTFEHPRTGQPPKPSLARRCPYPTELSDRRWTVLHPE